MQCKAIFYRTWSIESIRLKKELTELNFRSRISTSKVSLNFMTNTICCLNPYCEHPNNLPKQELCSYCGNKLVTLRNRYQPIRLISDEGGFGRTYLAEDLDKLNTECIIKQLAPQVQGTEA